MTKRIFESEEIKKIEYLKEGKFYYVVSFIQHDKELTICISSQIGCPMRCAFCAAGESRLVRNLNSNEITEQIIDSYISMESQIEKNKISGIKVLAEGMGEASFNIVNVLYGFRCARDRILKNQNIKYVNFGISTIGNPSLITEYPNIIKKDHEKKTKYDFQISLHSANNEDRKIIIPITFRDKETNSEIKLKEMVDKFGILANELNQPLKFNYMLLKKEDWKNYSTKDIIELVKLCEYVKSKGLKTKIKLTEYSETGKGFSSPEPQVFNKVRTTLISNGIDAEYVPLVGQNIKGACGQLNCSKEE